MSVKSHLPALIGLGSAWIFLQIFGKDSFILPAMIVIMIGLLSCRKVIEKKEGIEYAGE